MIWRVLKLVAALEIIVLAIWMGLIAYWFWESLDEEES